jgi:hypothetical protein
VDGSETYEQILLVATSAFSLFKSGIVLQCHDIKRITVMDNASEEDAVCKILEVAQTISTMALA